MQLRGLLLFCLLGQIWTTESLFVPKFRLKFNWQNINWENISNQFTTPRPTTTTTPPPTTTRPAWQVSLQDLLTSKYAFIIVDVCDSVLLQGIVHYGHS